jgi:hypothetical protein
MDRGPLALFGAIIAVGLGPAMWVGAQFGHAIEVPSAPPAVTSERGPQQKTQDKGGSAGSAPDTSVIVRTTPEAVIKPLPDATSKPAASRSAAPASSSARPAPSSASPSASSDDESPAPTGNDESAPADQSPGGTDPVDAPPSPPSGSDSGGSGGTSDGQPVAG